MTWTEQGPYCLSSDAGYKIGINTVQGSRLYNLSRGERDLGYFKSEGAAKAEADEDQAAGAVADG